MNLLYSMIKQLLGIGKDFRVYIGRNCKIHEEKNVRKEYPVVGHRHTEVSEDELLS